MLPPSNVNPASPPKLILASPPSDAPASAIDSCTWNVPLSESVNGMPPTKAGNSMPNGIFKNAGVITLVVCFVLFSSVVIVASPPSSATSKSKLRT